MYSHRWADEFNSWVNKWALIELNPSNKKFTWTNNQEHPTGLVYDQKGMMRVAVDFYKKLFAKDSEHGFKLGQNFWEEEDKVSRNENELLIAPFFE